MRLDEGFIPYGAQYYRYPTPAPSEWERDLARMKEAGFTVVRLWAIWRVHNPEKNVYRFDDLDALCELAGRNGLGVVINTMRECAPVWFLREYPDCAPVTAWGRRMEATSVAWRQVGGVPGPCYNHPEGRRWQRAFMEACAEHFAGRPELLAWDLWNEPSGHHGLIGGLGRRKRAEDVPELLCYCRHCEAAFKRWLERRYGTIEALNESWGRVYRSFDEVELPRKLNTISDVIDWRLFFTDVMVEHLRMCAEAVRAHDREHPLMYHSLCDEIWDHLTACTDDWKMKVHVDIVGNTSGFEERPYIADMLRSVAKEKPVWCCELHTAFGRTFVPPREQTWEEMKRHVLIPLFAGARGFIYWQYRPEVFGNEAPAWGLTALDGGDAPGLEHAGRLGRFLREHARTIHKMRRPPARVAIYYDLEEKLFAFNGNYSEETHHYAAQGFYKAMERANIPVDFVAPCEVREGILENYDVLLCPEPYWMHPETSARIKEWVAHGGVLLSEAYFAGYDAAARRHSLVVPGQGFDEVFGVRQVAARAVRWDFDQFCEERMEVPVGSLARGETFTGTIAEEIYEPIRSDVRVLARTSRGEPVAVEAPYGEGRAYLIGTYVGLAYERKRTPGTGRLLASLVERHIPAARPKVLEERAFRVSVMEGAGERWVLVENNEGAEAEATLWLPWRGRLLRNLLGGETVLLAERDGGVAASLALPENGVEAYRVE